VNDRKELHIAMYAGWSSCKGKRERGAILRKTKQAYPQDHPIHNDLKKTGLQKNRRDTKNCIAKAEKRGEPKKTQWTRGG